MIQETNYRRILGWIIFIFIITIPFQIFLFILYLDIATSRLHLYDYESVYKNGYYPNWDIFLKIILSVLSLLLVYSIRKTSKRFLNFIAIGIVYILFWIFIPRFLANINLYVNCNFGEQTRVNIEGIVIGKEKHDAYRGNYFKYYLNVKGKKIVFETSRIFYKKFNISDTLRLNMTKGSKGIIYKRFKPYVNGYSKDDFEKRDFFNF
ncbi:MAG: hypothetical protein RLZZ175_2812 [Bacteroidota bacterium]|jgi:hypothetical protein